MPMVKVRILNEGPAWPELNADDPMVIHIGNDAPPIDVVLLDRGMQSGKPSVAMRFDTTAGPVVIAETSARLFVTAARMIMARHPDLFDDEPATTQ